MNANLCSRTHMFPDAFSPNYLVMGLAWRYALHDGANAKTMITVRKSEACNIISLDKPGHRLTTGLYRFSRLKSDGNPRPTSVPTHDPRPTGPPVRPPTTVSLPRVHRKATGLRKKSVSSYPYSRHFLYSPHILTRITFPPSSFPHFSIL